MTIDKATTRFAPSPTGYLHLGHAFSALFAAQKASPGGLAANKKVGREAPGGRFIVRIEDIDRTRCRPEFTAAILEDLAWLGLEWEQPVRRQSEHMNDYQAALARLEAQGIIYPCFCTRADIAREIESAGAAPHLTQRMGPDGPIYPGICRRLSLDEAARRKTAGAAFALRLKTDEAMARTGTLTWTDAEAGVVTAQPELFGDVVLARKDTPTSYHLSVTVDDALQGVTLVTRGQDLFAATHIHRLLQALLDLPVPAYHHHSLLTGEDGARLAKRDKAATLRSLREAGRTPAEVRAMVGFA
ncbi:MAG TPA: tRNA glutamyl-Q(34) synthetase GluQRS [Magnetospirillaceae bacterium]|jgi:glutamyl-Q tRNA(Asp) synthetase